MKTFPKNKFEEDLNDIESAYKLYEKGEKVIPEVDNNKFIPAFVFELAKEVARHKQKLGYITDKLKVFEDKITRLEQQVTLLTTMTISTKERLIELEKEKPLIAQIDNFNGI